MSKRHLFENFNATAYDNTTDPYAAIFEGPKFTFGNTNKDTMSGDSEEGDEVGRVNHGEPIASFHTLTPEEEEKARKEANKLTGKELSDEEPSDLDRQANDLLRKHYTPLEILRAKHKTNSDAMNHVDDLGDFDIAYRDGELDDTDSEFGISGYEIVTPPSMPDELEKEEQFGLDDPEGVLGYEEPAIIDEPVETPVKDIIALQSISDEELIKELQYRMANKRKA
jgi:hypothetical protein